MSGKTLKVAHVPRRFVFEEWGGTETVVWNTVRRQKELGVDAEILATAALSSPGEEVRDGITIRRYPCFYPYFPMTEALRLQLDKKGGNPLVPALFKAIAHGGFDLIHIHCGGRMAVQCALLAKRLGIPSVISLHGGFADVPKEELKKMMAPTRGRFNYGGIIDRLAGYRRNPIAETDAVICISRREETLLKQSYPKQRIVYLPNGVNCEDFAEKPSVSPREEWGIPAKRRLILCISRIDYQKNQKALLSILAHDPESHLLLIGPVTAPWYRDEILASARQQGVAERLTIVPGLPPGDPRLKAILHEAELFVLPSLHEPFGIVALEAWASGIPVLASCAGGLRDFIRHGENGLLFDPESEESLLKNYELLRDDGDLRKRLAATALDDVRAYSWQSLTRRLLDLYGELLNGNE